MLGATSIEDNLSVLEGGKSKRNLCITFSGKKIKYNLIKINIHIINNGYTNNHTLILALDYYTEVKIFEFKLEILSCNVCTF